VEFSVIVALSSPERDIVAERVPEIVRVADLMSRVADLPEGGFISMCIGSEIWIWEFESSAWRFDSSWVAFREREVSWSWTDVPDAEFMERDMDVGWMEVWMVALVLRGESFEVPERAIVPLGRWSVTGSEVLIERERALVFMRASSWWSVMEREVFSRSLMRVSDEEMVMEVLIAYPVSSCRDVLRVALRDAAPEDSVIFRKFAAGV